MDFNQIKELIKIVDSSSFDEFNFSFENVKIAVKKKTPDIAVNPVPTVKLSHTGIMPNIDDVSEPRTILPTRSSLSVDGNIVTAPLVGTFYQSATPGKPPFVSIGDKVKKGDVLCIIEAMKVMNEITSKFDGTVSEVFALNEDMVEYGQPLFAIV